MPQPFANRTQQTIAALVTERVIDALEAVQVEQQHADAAAIAPGLPEHMSQMFLEQSAVGQVRQRVMLR
jgi:hypothetical protein